MEKSSFQFSVDIRQILRTSPNWYFNNDSGAHMTYYLGPLRMEFLATSEQMIAELRKQDLIKGNYSDAQNSVCLEDAYGNMSAVPLADFMSKFSQRDWIDFLVNFEFHKSLKKEVFSAAQTSQKRYSNAIVI